MIKQKLLDWTRKNSGLEDRSYLGMSQIGHCSLKIYNKLTMKQSVSLQDHLNCYSGYLFEKDMLARLKAIDPDALGSSEQFSDFQGRFLGHSDGSWEGRLLEIKSTTDDWLPSSNRLPRLVFWQVQTYMHYSGHDECITIYIARDTGRLWEIITKRNSKIGQLAALKAAEILDNLRRNTMPLCDCGQCGKRECNCGKPTYPDEMTANKFAEKFNKSANFRQYPYLCPDSPNCWHLTSMNGGERKRLLSNKRNGAIVS